MATKRRCKANTRNGSQCRNSAQPGSNYCHVHNYSRTKGSKVIKNQNNNDNGGGLFLLFLLLLGVGLAALDAYVINSGFLFLAGVILAVLAFGGFIQLGKENK